MTKLTPDAQAHIDQLTKLGFPADVARSAGQAVENELFNLKPSPGLAERINEACRKVGKTTLSTGYDVIEHKIMLISVIMCMRPHLGLGELADQSGVPLEELQAMVSADIDFDTLTIDRLTEIVELVRAIPNETPNNASV